VEAEGEDVADGQADDPVADDLDDEAAWVLPRHAGSGGGDLEAVEELEGAATKSSGMVAAMTARSAVKVRAMGWGKSRSTAEKTAMQPAPSRMAAQPADAASAGALRRWPDRHGRRGSGYRKGTMK